jgi:23S rRNA (guanine2445-N2)-methyltransferase / 23S rRNA (guanine2069-N7)-methyltransferase
MNTFLVTTSRGLDELLQSEIQRLCPDCETRLTPGAVHVTGALADAYRVCLWSRLANRVIWVLTSGSAESAEALYDTAASIDWSQHFASRNTLSVNFNGTNRAINNSQFGAVKIKDAIVDHFVEEGLARPNVDKFQPDIMISARCHRDSVIIGIDLAAGSLHQRAYREEVGIAPLKEHVASAMLMRSGWAADAGKPLVDPMCGSGTIVIEAAQIAANIAPALQRQRWGFTHWLGHQTKLWDEIFAAAQNAKQPITTPIFASDIDRRLISMAKNNADIAGVFDAITFSHKDVQNVVPPVTVKEAGYIVSNPPYGERLGELSDLIPLFAKLGQQLKEHWQDWHVSFLSSNRELLRILKLRATREYAMMNGKLECKLVNYQLDANNCQQFGTGSDNHDFANRIKKNQKKLKPWLKKQDTNCYRLYDADLPEYNVAVDCYGDWLVVQEYSPPKTIAPEKAQRRLQEVLLHLPAATSVSPKKIVLKVREQKKGKQQYEKLNQAGERMEVWENGARLWVNLTDYLDTGLFLDHRDTRLKIKQMAKNKDVLNLFSYTGSVSVSAALGGARSVTTVDMSKTYIDWAKDNFQLNHLKGPYEFVQADCIHWLDDHTGKYDLIFIDPPSFSNSKRMDSTWDVQRDHMNILSKAKACLREGGTIVFSNNKRGFKLDTDGVKALGLSIQDITKQTIPEDFSRHSSIHQCWILQA